MKLYNRKINDPAPLGQADPYVIKASDGRYYMYATGGQVYSSDELLNGWKYEGVHLDMPGQKVCWAPSVIEIDGKYYMYYSSIDEDCDDEHGHTMRVAVSDTPAGVFKYEKTLLPPFSIDAHVVETPSGLYLFYCNNDYEAERAGTYILCDRMESPLVVEGKPIPVVCPTIDEEIYMKDRFKVGQHWHTIEGAFYFYHDGIHFLMYSGACYQNPTYFIGYCIAHGPENADLRELEWKKYPDNHTYAPLLRKNEFIEGMGHNSVIFDNEKCYIIYHGRDNGDIALKEDARSARIDEMFIDREKLFVNVTR
ncbi:glycoside hydrolase family 43 protein [Kineothrix sp. MB12-C1]|uniref:glycoside hydrolase family 43 protein n=1 Tax=Kineothrix sp. MB12-C1 TaxID=3070215 RepID=UPI0027D32A78|nr:glycoside hydrolase family 43 protein [Kineothrix sp. MB12-C1]WMC91533.1 glycoside hydrolase family 43 protein [Kineothrix sp. MB12-C1]